MTPTLIANEIEPILERYAVPRGELLALLRDRFAPQLAFATGSFVEGRAGPTSDFDIRVVCCPSEYHPAVDRSFRREDLVWCGSTVMTTIGIRPVHVVFWPQDAIQSLRSKITDTVLDSENPLPVFTSEQVEFIEELQVAVPIIGVEEFSGFRDSMALDRFAEIHFQQLMAVYDQSCGETEGPLLTGDVALAAVRSAKAVDSAIDCYLFAHGRRVAKGKWRLRELLALHSRDDELVRRFLRYTVAGFDSYGAAGEEALREEVQERLSWCNDLLLRLQA